MGVSMRLFRTIIVSAKAIVYAYVPPHLELPATWTDVSTSTLTPLEFRSEVDIAFQGNDEASVVASSSCVLASEVIRKHSGKHGCIAFAVRRPALCREEGKAITDLAAREDNPLDGFGIFGVVKETGIDDVGLSEFQSQFFPYPLYKDDMNTFYIALGSRRLSLSSWNPINIFRGLRNVYRRLKRKKISGNLKGEGLIQGGVIIFDKTGKARYAYREETGLELPVDDIILVIKKLKEDKK